MCTSTGGNIAVASLFVAAVGVGFQGFSASLQKAEFDERKCSSNRAHCAQAGAETPPTNEERVSDVHPLETDKPPAPSMEPDFLRAELRSAGPNAGPIETPLPYSLSGPIATPARTGPDFDTAGFNSRDAAEASRPLLITNPIWAEQPSKQQLTRYYPRRALERGREGEVRLDCIAEFDGHLSCIIASETLPDWGFGGAALRASKRFRLASTLSDGRSTAGARLEVPILFEIANN